VKDIHREGIVDVRIHVVEGLSSTAKLRCEWVMARTGEIPFKSFRNSEGTPETISFRHVDVSHSKVGRHFDRSEPVQ
jgi:hypothetical protein